MKSPSYKVKHCLKTFKCEMPKKANVYIYVKYGPWESYYVEMSAKKTLNTVDLVTTGEYNYVYSIP